MILATNLPAITITASPGYAQRCPGRGVRRTETMNRGRKNRNRKLRAARSIASTLATMARWPHGAPWPITDTSTGWDARLARARVLVRGGLPVDDAPAMRILQAAVA